MVKFLLVFLLLSFSFGQSFALENLKNENPALKEANQSPVLKSEEKAWELQVKNALNAVVEIDPAVGRKSLEAVPSGTKLNYLSSETWHKVNLPSGEFAWISGNDLKDSLTYLKSSAYKNYLFGNYNAALENYSLISQLDSSSKEVNLWLAKINWKLNNTHESAEYLKEAQNYEATKISAFSLAHTYAHELFRAANLKLRNNDFKKASEVLESALLFKPDSKAIFEKSVFCYQQLKDEENLNKVWRNVLSNDSLNESALAYFGYSKSGTSVVINMPKQTLEEKKTPAVNVSKSEAPVPKTAATVKPKIEASGPIDVLQGEKTSKGTPIKTALNSVLNLTESFGTTIGKKDWVAQKKEKEKYLVSFVCYQDQTGKGSSFKPEYFRWLIDLKTKDLSPLNKNAQLLMNRW
jgi:tetratricopeptide (TPR) repeat protein